jgi:hypothetical protein
VAAVVAAERLAAAARRPLGVAPGQPRHVAAERLLRVVGGLLPQGAPVGRLLRVAPVGRLLRVAPAERLLRVAPAERVLRVAPVERLLRVAPVAAAAVACP